MSNNYYYQSPHTPDESIHTSQPSDYLNSKMMPHPSSTTTPDHGYYEGKRADSPYYQEDHGPAAAAAGGGGAGAWSNNNYTSAPVEDPYDEKAAPKKKKKTCANFICCPCCCCCPMWIRWICCFILIVIIIIAIVAGVLVATFKVPTIEMNGVTDDPSGLPRFQRQGVQYNENMAFTINLGLMFGINNPNVETLTLASVDAVAFYPTAPTTPIADGQIKDVHINRFGFTNFTFPIHIHYNNTADPNFIMLRDIHSRCSNGQDLSVNADIKPVVSVIGVHIPIPTIHHTVNFACPIPAGQLPQAVVPF